MRIVDLPLLWTVILDVLAWLGIHMGLSYVMTRLPVHRFNPEHWMCRERTWEGEGRFYETLFRVMKWKALLPEGAALFKEGFRKRALRGKDKEYFSIFVRETCRADYTHWLTLIVSPLFFLWNPFWVGVGMVGYAVAVNLPCIIAQRYNRVRLRGLLVKISQRGNQNP
jgi:glycosyl-4,4'-diaponeurosporenoate acyltransferase